jgi:ATP-dependent protease HslVU (ClpYQ) peptidase subunit
MPTSTSQSSSNWFQKVVDFFDGSVDAARTGSRTDALILLKRFTENPSAADPALIEYVADCIREWAKDDFKSAKAARCFHISRPKHSPGIKGTEEKHISIVETYLQHRAKGLASGEAIHQTATKRHCSKKLVEKLIVGLHKDNDERPFTKVQNAATRRLLAAPDFDSALLQRALGLGWGKWVRDHRASEARWSD